MSARINVINDSSYRPYCLGCSTMSRMLKIDGQFECLECGTRTNYEKAFSDKYIKGRSDNDQSCNDCNSGVVKELGRMKDSK